MNFSKIVPFASVVLLASSFPNTAIAGPKNDLKDASKLAAEQIRSLGEPMDRCSFDASLTPNNIVAEKFNSSKFKLGDRITTLNGTDFSGKDRDAVISYLRKQSPDQTLDVSVVRNGAPINITEICINSRPKMQTMLTALDFAGKRKFDDCYDTLSNQSNLNPAGLSLKLQCATVQKKPDRYDLNKLSYDVLEGQIKHARYNEPVRAAVMQSLIASSASLRAGVGKEKTDKLIAEAKNWPDGENMWEDMQPNFREFRSRAESQIKKKLIDPASASIEWPYEFTYGTWKPFLGSKIEGYWSCGVVNAKNRMGGFTGRTFFIAVVGSDGTVKHTGIGTNDDIDIVSAQCEGAIPQMTPRVEDQETVNDGGSAKSLTEELSTLVQLHTAGALTDEEFQAAKAKLLAK
ncbi:SHOCT domain-containing protein [Hellea sp.]|nr:SHOCT domain-containing protein [Hellea sp.]